MQNVNNLMRQWNASYRHVQYWLKNNAYRDMMQCVLNCTVTYARKWEENYTTNTSVTIYRNPYKQVMNIRLPYYGYYKATSHQVLIKYLQN